MKQEQADGGVDLLKGRQRYRPIHDLLKPTPQKTPHGDGLS